MAVSSNNSWVDSYLEALVRQFLRCCRRLNHLWLEAYSSLCLHECHLEAVISTACYGASCPWIAKVLTVCPVCS